MFDKIFVTDCIGVVKITTPVAATNEKCIAYIERLLEDYMGEAMLCVVCFPTDYHTQLPISSLILKAETPVLIYDVLAC